MSYYVNYEEKPIGKDYVFSELINLAHNKSENQVLVSFSVKYFDQRTTATQISQFDLVLENCEMKKRIQKAENS